MINAEDNRLEFRLQAEGSAFGTFRLKAELHAAFLID
jgi:hypothetical protein